MGIPIIKRVASIRKGPFNASLLIRTPSEAVMILFIHAQIAPTVQMKRRYNVK
jgi:hypothetical protein